MSIDHSGAENAIFIETFTRTSSKMWKTHKHDGFSKIPRKMKVGRRENKHLGATLENNNANKFQSLEGETSEEREEEKS